MRIVQKVLDEDRSKSFKTHPEKKSIAEQFCYGNTLPLIIKLEKLIQIFLVL